MIKVGIVGFGMVAQRFHVPLLRAEKRLCLTHVVERHQSRSLELEPSVITLRSVEELWDSEVEVVVILTPNETHAELAEQALRAGKHVVVDKPFTVSSVQADRLMQVAMETERLLTVFHNRRWDNDFLTVAKLLREGRLGRLRRFESRWERYRPSPKGGWREELGAGSGGLYDLGSHLMDQTLTLFGKPHRLFAHLQIQRDSVHAVDCFDLRLDYGGFQACLHSDCLTAAPSFRFALHGENGSFVKTGLDPQEAALSQEATPGSAGWGEETETDWGVLRFLGKEHESLVLERVPSEKGNYPEFYRNLAAALQGEESIHVSAEQARDVILGLELALASERDGGWVDWPANPREEEPHDK